MRLAALGSEVRETGQAKTMNISDIAIDTDIKQKYVMNNKQLSWIVHFILLLKQKPALSRGVVDAT